MNFLCLPGVLKVKGISICALKKGTIAYTLSLRTIPLNFSHLQTQKIIGLQFYPFVSESYQS